LRTSQTEHAKKLKHVIRANTELRGQKSYLTRGVANSRNRLKKAKKFGFTTITQHYENDEVMKLTLWNNRGWTKDDMQTYEQWLAEEDKLALTPVQEKKQTPKWRQRFEGTTIVASMQGGSYSKDSCPAALNPSYQQALAKSDSLADNRKRRVAEADRWKEEPPTKVLRCCLGHKFHKLKLDRETVAQEYPGYADREDKWQELLRCHQCDSRFPDADLMYARCEDKGHKAWICINCFEEPTTATLASTQSSYSGQQSSSSRSTRWPDVRESSCWGENRWYADQRRRDRSAEGRTTDVRRWK